MTTTAPREGSLEAPTRHPLDWNSVDFYNEKSLQQELERVFDICHGCRRCVNLCQSFPTLFDLVDGSETMEVDGVCKDDYWKVVDHCFLCDLCYLTKCPYVPPHEWNVDFPHLMLRAKAVRFKQGKSKVRDRLITNTDAIGKLAGIPIVVNVVNAINNTPATRKLLDKTLGIHPNASVPKYQSKTLRKTNKARIGKTDSHVAEPAGRTQGKVALFGTCYGNYNEPHLGEDLIAVFEHNNIPVVLLGKEQCCGMPKLELGDLESVAKAKDANIAVMLDMIERSYDIVGPIPSCILMFKQELPLMFPDDAAVQKIKQHIYDPFEYLMLRHKQGKLKVDFNNSLGKVSYHVACHQRVQNIGMKTRDILKLIPGTEIKAIERCSGHDGTYALKSEFHTASMKIARPVINQIKREQPDYYSSDCPMAGHQLEIGISDTSKEDAMSKAPTHPLSLLKHAYGI